MQGVSSSKRRLAPGPGHQISDIMNITRHNYEEYFILYMDNELGSEDRRQVELFVKENADLKEELDWLLQSRLVPDASLVFDNKEQLMKMAGTGSINTTNYEEWLLLYADNELTTEQKISVEKFAATHPAIQQEFEILLKTRLHPESEIVFHNKELLYRHEEKVRVIAINWRKIAVAAALIAISVTAFMVTNNKNDSINEGLATANTAPGKKSSTGDSANQTPVATNNVNPIVEESNSNAAKNETPLQNNPASLPGKKAIASSEKNTRSSVLPIKEKDPIVADNTSDNPNVKKNTMDENPIAQIDVPAEKSLTDLNENITDRGVTPSDSQPLDKGLTFAATETVDPADEEQPGKKNKFRGFFRKVTRTFEKTTNIKATDDEDRLLLGGLAIKL